MTAPGPGPGRIYSVGYEGLSVEGLVDRLVGARVTTLVDVRLNPSSRKPGFTRRHLAEALAEAGIGYIHERSLGNPPDNRAAFRSGDANEGRARMRALLANEGRQALRRVVELASSGRIAVMCVERDPARCHRDVVIDIAVERDPTIDVLQVL